MYNKAIAYIIVNRGKLRALPLRHKNAHSPISYLIQYQSLSYSKRKTQKTDKKKKGRSQIIFICRWRDP